MGKTTWGAELNEDSDAYLREYKQRRGVNKSEALRRMVQKGIEADRQDSPLVEATLNVALLMILAAASTLVMGTAYGQPMRMVYIAGGFGVGALLAAVAYAIATRRPGTRLGRYVRRLRSPARADGGDRE